MAIAEFASSISDELVALRRDLHQMPEIGLDLPQTQARVLSALEGLPLEISLGTALTSITAVLRGGKAAENIADRPVVLLRGDMDALPVTEETGLDFASTNGNMHACGHDLHMTGLVGAAKALCAIKDELPGDVVFMFQPGEEGDDGASHMITEGILDAAGKRVDAAFAIHVFSAIERGGVFACRPGTIMASSDIVKVEFIGRGGHGSTPQLAADPVPALAEMVTATHAMVTRQFSIFDPVVVTVGRLAAGTAPNVIPERGELEATLRAFNDTNRHKLFDGLTQLADGIAAAHGLRAETTVHELYPPTVNDDAQYSFVEETLTEVFGADRFVRWENPLAGAEDFSRVLAEVPGAFIGLSAVPPDKDPLTAPFNHSAYASYDDAVVVDAAVALSELAVRALNRLAE